MGMPLHKRVLRELKKLNVFQRIHELNKKNHAISEKLGVLMSVSQRNQELEKELHAIDEKLGALMSVLQRNQELEKEDCTIHKKYEQNLDGGKQASDVLVIERYFNKLIAEVMPAIVANQLTLATLNKDTRKFDLVLPGNSLDAPLGTLRVNVGEEGRFYLTSAGPDPKTDHPVVFVSIPKSGTHLIALLFSNLGFISTPFSSLRDACDLLETVDMKTGVTMRRAMPFPYSTQVKLMSPGQFNTGHLSADCVIDAFPDSKRILFSIRDLRYVAISHRRYEEAIWKNISYTDGSEESMFAYITSDRFQWLLDIVRSQVPLIGNSQVVRFEDITSANSEQRRPAVESFARVSGMEFEKIEAALEQSVGQKTHTYTGKYSTLEGVWSQRVEDAFVAAGGDVLNEALGYERRWQH